MAIDDMLSELKDLAKVVDDASKKIGEFKKPVKESSDSIPLAQDGISDIIKETEKAANSIMNLLDEINENSDNIDKSLHNLIELNPIKKIKESLINLKDLNKKNLDKILDVLSLLSFQDLTGQKLYKIQNTLNETKIKLLKVLVDTEVEAKDIPKEKKAEIYGKLKDMVADNQKMAQNDVNSMLSELGF
ncbi:MAG: protein phosphatase CheZ [Deltaproteobacteria bacterium]|jgi:chemotaxis protein CheZ|nr:protein phosphatase CheZ [Deltaproteobacteria bacterium]